MMKTLPITLVFWLIFSSFVSIEAYTDSDCSVLHFPDPTPRECCDYPVVYINHKSLQKCFSECSSVKPDSKYETDEEKEKDTCCFVRCIYEAEDILRSDGTTDNQKLKENFKTKNGTDLSLEWRRVIARSVRVCGEKYPQTDQIEKCLPMYHRKVLKCSYIATFLDCVDYKQTDACLALRKNVGLCSNSNDMTLEDWAMFFG